MDLNEKIEKDLNNKDILKIMNKASSRFRNQLDGDEIYTCQINALWKAHVNFKPERKAKFTTYLFNGVFIECLKAVKFKNKLNDHAVKLHDNISSGNSNFLHLELMDELQNSEEKDLILDRMSRMTIKEIAAKHSVSRETIRKKIKKITERFKYKFN
jgi:DNA-directed RNA polymerase specialized sigma24 family protein